MKTLCYLAAIISAGASCALAEDYGPELPPMTGRGAPAIRGVTPSGPTVPRFGKFELTVELAAGYDNPFDPEQVDLTAEFISPAGKHVVVPGFFCQVVSCCRRSHRGISGWTRPPAGTRSPWITRGATWCVSTGSC